MTFSTIPAVLDALVAKAVAALPGVQVIDGSPIVTDGDFLAVGFTGIPGDDAVEDTRTREQMGDKPDRENYDVICFASTWQGDDDIQTVRARMFDQIGAFDTAIRQDSTLGGLALRARLSFLAYAPDQTDQGVQVTGRFAIRVDAFTPRT